MRESAELVRNPPRAVEEVGYALFSSQQLQQRQKTENKKKTKQNTSIMQHTSNKLLNYNKAAEMFVPECKKEEGRGLELKQQRCGTSDLAMVRLPGLSSNQP